MTFFLGMPRPGVFILDLPQQRAQLSWLHSCCSTRHSSGRADNGQEAHPGGHEAEDPADKEVMRVSCGACGCLSLVLRVCWCVLCRLIAEKAQKRQSLRLDIPAAAAQKADAQASAVCRPIAEVHEGTLAAVVAHGEVTVSNAGAEPPSEAVPAGQCRRRC